MNEQIEIPKWNELLGKTLLSYKDGKAYAIRDTKTTVADKLGLSEELRSEITPKVGENKIEGRVGWAIYIGLKKPKLIEEATRGHYKITERGKKLLEKTNGEFDENYLIENYQEYAEYVKLRQRGENKREKRTAQVLDDMTPEELIGNAMEKLDNDLQSQLLGEMQKMNPYRFESVIADLLKAMGYGESFTTKKSNDGGVDAIVDEDALGLSKIYAQAKRYADNNKVQKKAIRDFLGSLAERKTAKGIFITTSDYSDDAKSLAEEHSVRLISGDELTNLMIQYNVGVSFGKTYQIKKLDSDYFIS